MNLNITTIPKAKIEYVNITNHAINPFEVLLIITLFGILAYLYIMVHKDKEKYSAWTNPNGHTINLYKQIKIFFWLYVAIVIILGLIQVFYMR